MTIVAEADSAVKPVDIERIVKRSIGLHKAAQILADAVRSRIGVSPLPLPQMPADEAMWCRQITQQMIEAFELGERGKPDQKQALKRHDLERIAAVQMERQKAQLLSTRLGHDLGTWREVPDSYHEEAACQRCQRTVRITVSHNPALEVQTAGPALLLACSAGAV